MRINEQKKSALGHLEQWKRSRAGSLSDVYRTGGSSRKQAAWRHCQRTCEYLNGTNLKIVSHNVNIFTAGFQFVNPETGVVQFFYITPSYEIAVDMQ